jgi:hypothetical protein
VNALRQSPSGKVLGQVGEFTAAIPATVGGTPATVTSAPGVAQVGGVVIGAGSVDADANQLFTVGSGINRSCRQRRQFPRPSSASSNSSDNLKGHIPMKLRSGPSGPLFSGNPGDVLVCIGGSEWAPGPGGGRLVQRAYGLIDSQAVVPPGIDLPLPTTVPVVFPTWTAGDTLDVVVAVPIGNTAVTPDAWTLVLLPQVSIDNGATWQHVGDPSGLVAFGYQAGVTPGAANGSSIGCTFAVPLSPPPGNGVGCRLTYQSSVTWALGSSIAPPGPVAILRAERVPAALVVQPSPLVLVP